MTEFDELIWTAESINRFWDWQSKFPENYFTYQFGAQIAEHLSINLHGKEVLDYGCGVGHLLPHLCKYASEVYAADTSSESVLAANQRMAGYSKFKGAFQIERLESTGKKFDVILVIEVVEHLYDEHLNDLLDSVKGLLSDNGVVIFTTPNNEDLSKSMMVCPESGKVFHKWQHVRRWDAKSLQKYLNSKGFHVVNTVETNFAKTKIKSPVGLLRAFVRRIFHGRQGKPHLSCVAKMSPALLTEEP